MTRNIQKCEHHILRLRRYSSIKLQIPFTIPMLTRNSSILTLFMSRLVWNHDNLFAIPNEPAHEIMVLLILRKLSLQTRMHSHPVELDVWFLVRPYVYFHTLCVRTAKALARLHEYAGSPKPSLVAYVISTIIS